MNPVTVPSFALPAKGGNAGQNGLAKNDKTSFGDTLRSAQERPRNADQRAARNDQPLARLVAKLAEALEQADTTAPAAEPNLEVAPRDTKDEDTPAQTTEPKVEEDDAGLVPVIPVSFTPPAAAPAEAEAEPVSKTMSSQQADTTEQGEQRTEATTSEKESDAVETPARPATIELRAGIDPDTARPVIAAAAQSGTFVTGARVAEIVQAPQSARSRALNDIAAIFNGQLQQAAWPAAKEEQEAPPSASAQADEAPTNAAPPATPTVEAEAPVPAGPSAKPATGAEQKPQANAQTREQPRDPLEAAEPNKADGIAAKAPGGTAAPLTPNATVASVVDAVARDSAAQPAASASAPQAAAHTTGAPQPHTLKIQLNPVELGMVTATLRMSGDQMTVELTTEKMEAYERLSVDSDTIVKSLRGLGIQVDQLTVQPPQVTATGAARPEGPSAQTFSGGQQQQSAQTGNMGGGERNGRSGGSDQGGFQNGSNATGDAAPFGEDRARRGLVI